MKLLEGELHQNGLKLSEVKNLSLLKQVYELRVQAWRDKVEIPSDADCWVDPEDSLAQHWVVLAQQMVIAAARMTIHHAVEELPDREGYMGVLDVLPAPIGSLNRCVVHPDFRHRGLSRVLDEVRISSAKSSGCRSLVICATDLQRAAAISALGFQFRGEGPKMPIGLAAGTRSLVYTMILAA